MRVVASHRRLDEGRRAPETWRYITSADADHLRARCSCAGVRFRMATAKYCKAAAGCMRAAKGEIYVKSGILWLLRRCACRRPKRWLPAAKLVLGARCQRTANGCFCWARKSAKGKARVWRITCRRSFSAPLAFLRSCPGPGCVGGGVAFRAHSSSAADEQCPAKPRVQEADACGRRRQFSI